MVLSDEEANSWTAIFDPKCKGKSGHQHRPADRARPGDHGDELARPFRTSRTPAIRPRPKSTRLPKFLISKKKEGQFRALWGDFGELVNLMASGEMVVCDAWQPAVMAVKAQGKPCKYAVPKEGYRAWAIGPCR